MKPTHLKDRIETGNFRIGIRSYALRTRYRDDAILCEAEIVVTAITPQSGKLYKM
jgi:hypothetical protein